MPDDVEPRGWWRRSGGGRLFTGRRSHRRRTTPGVPRAVLGGLAVILAGGALLAGLGDDGPTPPDRPPVPDAQAPPVADAWAPPPPPSATSAAPSPSPSSASASATPSGAASAAPPVQAAGSGAVLELSRGAVPAVVDLAAEGGRDWMHWAEDSAFSTERRRGGGFAILEGTPVAPRERHTGSPERFRWTGGTPVGSSGGSRSGVRTCGAGSAFTVSAPAGRASRTLRLYVGAWQAEGVLTARLSTGGTAVTGVLDSPGAGPGGTAVFTLTYQAPRDGRLELTWSTGRTYAGGCAGVALQAATLR